MSDRIIKELIVTNEQSDKKYKTSERPIQLLLSNHHMKHIKYYSQDYTAEEIQLANEIAERLHDPASLTQFLRFTREVPHDVLRKILNKACSTPENEVRKSRAAIFVNSVNIHQRYGNDYSRN